MDLSDNPGAASEPAAGASAPATAQATAGATTTATPQGSDPLEGLDPDQTLEPTVEEIEEELEGVKVRGRKDAIEKIKSERLMHADYTRKTMGHADQVRAFEAQRQSFQQNVQVQQEFMREVATVTAIDDRLTQLSQLDWQALNAQNPQQAQALHLEFTQLQTRRGAVVGSLSQKQQQLQQARNQDLADRARNVEAFLRREIKDWSPERDREMESYVKAEGIDPAKLANFMLYAPEIARVVHKAAQFDRLMKARAKAAPPPPPQAGTRVGGAAATHTKPLSEVTDPQEWRTRRAERKRNR